MDEHVLQSHLPQVDIDHCQWRENVWIYRLRFRQDVCENKLMLIPWYCSYE